MSDTYAIQAQYDYNGMGIIIGAKFKTPTDQEYNVEGTEDNLLERLCKLAEDLGKGEDLIVNITDYNHKHMARARRLKGMTNWQTLI